MVIPLDERCDSPDLDSLNTEMTYRRKLVSCTVLLETWFLGEMSSWHHSGPYALINQKTKKCHRCFPTYSCAACYSLMTLLHCS